MRLLLGLALFWPLAAAGMGSGGVQKLDSNQPLLPNHAELKVNPARVQMPQVAASTNSTLAGDVQRDTPQAVLVLQQKPTSASNTTNSTNSTKKKQNATVPAPTPTPAPGMTILAETHITGLDSPAGAMRFEVHKTTGFTLGGIVRINPGGITEEDNQITDFGSIILSTPTRFTHGMGEKIWMINREDSQYGVPFQQSAQSSSGSTENIFSSMTRETVMSLVAAVFGVWFLLAYIINLFEGKKGLAALPFASCCIKQNRFAPVP